MNPLPKRYAHLAREAHWRQQWDAWGVYRHNPNAPAEETFVVDTPPPTVSGTLHVGHAFSYTHQDLLVRYQRMKGRNIHYGMGWDDNGLPTERRVQHVFGLICDPSIPYDPSWKPTRATRRSPTQRVSRQNFIEACQQLTAEDEQAFEQMWRRLGLSVDWSLTYRTIGRRARSLAQASFLALAKRGEAYQAWAPTMWDVDFQTAIAQAEVEDRPMSGWMSTLHFGVEGQPGQPLPIATTRPELLGACIAVVVHPDDARWCKWVGHTAITPLYQARVPIMASTHAEPDKGTGVLMVCTFGDAADVEWWSTSGLPLKPLLDKAGCLRSDVVFEQGPFASSDPDRASQAHMELAGLYTQAARTRILGLLREPGTDPSGGGGAALAGEPRPVEQRVRCYEKGRRPIEYLTTRQWFIRLMDHRDALLEQGRAISWVPETMRLRYEHWVQGLNQDWCISRQRYFGVPFPVWYPLDGSGEPRHDQPIWAEPERLPIDPMACAPTGYTEEQRGQPGGFVADRDVMDTWATSSLTPQIQLGWEPNGARPLPMDIRPQSHEIIRTWALYTIAMSWLHHGVRPWRRVLISGWILDPDRKKMSKSRGNAQTPEHLFDAHSVDAVRYWAARARLGADTALDSSTFPVGRRLATKIFNASRFVGLIHAQAGEMATHPRSEQAVWPLDRAFLAMVRRVVVQATEAFEEDNFAQALRVSEEAFWSFCDHYLELAKGRAYGEDDSPARSSALAGLWMGLRVLLRLLAPFLPYVTEECWSWWYASGQGRARSIHVAPWPSPRELEGWAAHDEGCFQAAVQVMGSIRSAKTEAQRSLKWPVARLEVSGPAEQLDALDMVRDDVARAGWLHPEAMVRMDGSEAETLETHVDLAKKNS
ncbi:MAG: valine--tRNA ligase [Myxococcota bacterium]